MKNNRYLLPAMLGIPAAALRFALYRTGLDAKNLLTPATPLEILLWLVIAACLVWTVLILRTVEQETVYENNFSRSGPAAMGHMAFALAIFRSAASAAGGSMPLLVAMHMGLGIAGAVGLFLAGRDRYAARKPVTITYVVLTVFLALHMILGYKDWSSNPQLQDYVFSLLGGVCLMLCAYHQAAFCCDKGSRKTLLFFSTVGCCMCLAAAAHDPDPAFWFAGAAWLAFCPGDPQLPESEVAADGTD